MAARLHILFSVYRSSPLLGICEFIVRDPQGARVPSADVIVLTAQRAEVAKGHSDTSGLFTAPGLAPGAYTVSVSKEGFASAEKPVEVADRDAEIVIDLGLASVETTLEVGSARSTLAKSDPNYRALRDGAIESTVSVQNLTLIRDQGQFTFREGGISFLAPVLGKTVTAVFTGSGTFTLKPLIEPERNYLVMVTGADTVEEEFESAAVFLFTDGTEAELRAKSSPAADDGHAASTLKRLRSRCRHRAMTARSFVEDLLQGDDTQNLDAELLAELYNPAGAGPFRAYIHGRKRDDLRFLVVPRGAVRDLPRRRSRSSTWTPTVLRTGSGTSLT